MAKAAKGDASADRETDREYVAGLAKGLAVIAAFEQKQSALTVAEASQSAQISRAAARRCLRTLQHLGYADHDGKYYRLSPRILRLAHAYVSSNALPRFVQPIIEAVSERTQRSMSVAIMDRFDIVVIARAHVRRSLSGGLGIGTRLPAHCSANGRVLLSSLSDSAIERLFKNVTLRALTSHTKTKWRDVMKEIKAARTLGYAVNEQEVELGVRTIAVPVRDRMGAIAASLSMSAPVGDSDRHGLTKMLPDLQAARGQIERAL
jgi:IclR family pca regulon transcriptional regulator